MAVDPRIDLVPHPYMRGIWDSSWPGLQFFLTIELEKLQRSIEELREAAPQVADTAPVNPRKGTIRYAVAPWNPLGTGDGWVWWNGSAWVAL